MKQTNAVIPDYCRYRTERQVRLLWKLSSVKTHECLITIDTDLKVNLLQLVSANSQQQRRKKITSREKNTASLSQTHTQKSKVFPSLRKFFSTFRKFFSTFSQVLLNFFASSSQLFCKFRNSRYTYTPTYPCGHTNEKLSIPLVFFVVIET